MIIKDYRDLNIREAKMIDALINDIRRLSHDFKEAQIEFEKYVQERGKSYEEGEIMLKTCGDTLYSLLDEMDTLVRIAKGMGLYR